MRRKLNSARSGLKRLLSGLLLAASLNLPALAAVKPEDAAVWVSGGVTRDERDLMQKLAGDYSLWLITAEQQSGSYLSDVHISIRDQKGTLRFDQLLDGPWLFVQLPPGSYDLVGTISGQRLHRTVRLRGGKTERVYLHFQQ